jgi:AraC family transcriptional regulator of adaptative response/methylated-DNA-[protein]-cysteine methyltransferase
MNTPTLVDAARTGQPRTPFLDDAACLAAVRARDAQADGQFFYSVATTGVYCYPSCAARPALRRNLAFHASREAAERAGFRACKRCRADLPPRTEREAAMIAAACRSIERAEDTLPLADLAAMSGRSPHHFHRLFRRIVGVTPQAYAAAQRQSRLQSALAGGAGVTEAIYAARFNSSGRFYEAADAMLGMTASHYRTGGKGETIRFACGRSSLGEVLVAATERGICAILLGDAPGELSQDLARRFPHAALQPAEADVSEWIRRVVALVDDPRGGPAAGLPLDIRGTAFQRRVWELLRAIPPGQTRSYGEVAAQLGNPAAVRAVAGACAANALAVAIPCHRVVAAHGGLAGYRWGIARKRQLLERERGA